MTSIPSLSVIFDGGAVMAQFDLDVALAVARDLAKSGKSVQRIEQGGVTVLAGRELQDAIKEMA